MPQENVQVIGDIPAAAAVLEASGQAGLEGDEDLYVVTCFSDRDKLLDLPAVKKEAL